MFIKVYKNFNSKIVEDEISLKCWEMLTYSEDGSKNGWYEMEKQKAPKPTKEVEKIIEKRTKKEDTSSIKDVLDVDSMKRQELFAWLKENNISFDPKQKNVELKEIIKNATSYK